MEHQEQAEERSANLALYALGVLETKEAQAVTACLTADGTPSATELQVIERVVGLLGYSAPTASPPPTLKVKLLNRIQAEAVTEARTRLVSSAMNVASLKFRLFPLHKY